MEVLRHCKFAPLPPEVKKRSPLPSPVCPQIFQFVSLPLRGYSFSVEINFFLTFKSINKELLKDFSANS